MFISALQLLCICWKSIIKRCKLSPCAELWIWIVIVSNQHHILMSLLERAGRRLNVSCKWNWAPWPHHRKDIPMPKQTCLPHCLAQKLANLIHLISQLPHPIILYWKNQEKWPSHGMTHNFVHPFYSGIQPLWPGRATGAWSPERTEWHSLTPLWPPSTPPSQWKSV